MSLSPTPFSPAFLHGTKADLKIGDLIEVGYASNFLKETSLSWVYFTSTLDAAIWGAELAAGEGRERVYLVEATGPYEDDPNLTDKKFRETRHGHTARENLSRLSPRCCIGRDTRPSKSKTCGKGLRGFASSALTLSSTEAVKPQRGASTTSATPRFSETRRGAWPCRSTSPFEMSPSKPLNLRRRLPGVLCAGEVGRQRRSCRRQSPAGKPRAGGRRRL